MRQPWFGVLFGGWVVVVVLAGALGAQQPAPVGRWVNNDPMDFQMLVLDVERDGTVHLLMPAPQFSATYRFEAGQLFIRGGDGSTFPSFVLRGDTLLLDGQPQFVRFPGAPEETAGIRGTWRQVAGGRGRQQFWTFRSDGQVILEVGVPVSVTLTGDTLTLASGSFTVRQVEDTLHVENPGKQRRFVRRPWGCFGTKSDLPAPECRQR